MPGASGRSSGSKHKTHPKHFMPCHKWQLALGCCPILHRKKLGKAHLPCHTSLGTLSTQPALPFPIQPFSRQREKDPEGSNRVSGVTQLSLLPFCHSSCFSLSFNIESWCLYIKSEEINFSLNITSLFLASCRSLSF